MHKNTLKKPNSQLHPNSLSPTRQENTILYSYAAARLLGIFFFTLTACPISQTLYIYIYIYRSAVLGIIILVEFGVLWLAWACGNSSHTGPLQQEGLESWQYVKPKTYMQTS